VRQAERLVALEDKLPALLSGKMQPANPAEQVAIAQFCCDYKKRYATAVRFFADAFAAEPKLAEERGSQTSNRYNAASCAVLAAAGLGTDAAQLADAERSRLRQQALDWLTADLAAGAKLAERPDARARLRQALEKWQKDIDLASVRNETALAKLPEAEREAWRKLWSDVAALIARTDAPKAPDSPRPKQ
jgi:serine/threonine-protein kinase